MLKQVSICSSVALSLSIFLAIGCGGGQGTSTTSTSPPPTQTGPKSGSEFLYAFGTGNDVYVSPLNPTSGQLGAYIDATPNLFPQIEPSSLVPNPVVSTPNGKFLYVAGFDQVDGGIAIFGLSVSGAAGQLAPLSSFPTALGPPLIPDYNGFVIDGKGRYLYVSYPDGPNANHITPYSIDQNSGLLTAVPGFEETSPVGQIALQAADPAGRYVYAWATYPAGIEIFVYAIDQNTGAVSEVPGSPFPVVSITSGASNNVEYIQMFADPSEKYIYLYYVGAPASPASSVANIYIYLVDPTTGALTPTASSPFAVPSGAGGRVAVSPSGNLLYAQQSILSGTTYTPDIGVFQVNQVDGSIGANPIFSEPGSFGNSEAYPDPAGGVLLLGPGGTNYVTMWSFTVNNTTGTLTPSAGSPFFADNSYRDQRNYYILRVP